ncbi:MAG: DUF2062 domain-containing protein [Pseudomonadota bacterium]
MPKKFIRRIMPHHDTIRQHKNLQFLGERLHDPNLWHLNRRSVSAAFAVGLFTAWIPTPGQMAIAAVAAFYLRANLPISVVLVWVTNPLTMPPMFYFAYRVGLSALSLPQQENFSFSTDTFLSGLGDIWQPFLLGCLILGTISAIAGFFGMRALWRYVVIKQWIRRKDKQPPVS